jgi:sigma-B regulation protein RsbU (phosphoserine phosphatase)
VVPGGERQPEARRFRVGGNAQLCADLSDGRFITAWLGEIDARDGTLTGFSCGQGPLLYYRAADDRTEVIETDAIPLGCFEDLPVTVPSPRRMDPGDVFVVLSDGVVEAENASGEHFGTERVIDVIARRHAEPAADIVAALREALSAFADGTPADDDRTVLVVRRSE